MNRGTRLSGCVVVSMLFVIAACESYDSRPIDTIPIDTIPTDTIPIDTIPIDTIHHNSIVPFTISALNNTSGLNAYCFFPVTFTANPRQEDRSHIDSILLYTDELRVSPYRLNAQNNYTAVFDYADTGSHSVLMRTYNAVDDVPYRDTAAIVKIGTNFTADELDFSIDDTGGVAVFKAAGSKADRVIHNWDLRRLGAGYGVQTDDLVTIRLPGSEVSDTVFLWQSRLDTINKVLTEVSTIKKAYAVNVRFKTYNVFINNGGDGMFAVDTNYGRKIRSGRTVDFTITLESSLTYSRLDSAVLFDNVSGSKLTRLSVEHRSNVLKRIYSTFIVRQDMKVILYTRDHLDVRVYAPHRTDDKDSSDGERNYRGFYNGMSSSVSIDVIEYYGSCIGIARNILLSVNRPVSVSGYLIDKSGKKIILGDSGVRNSSYIGRYSYRFIVNADDVPGGEMGEAVVSLYYGDNNSKKFELQVNYAKHESVGGDMGGCGRAHMEIEKYLGF